MKPLLLLPLFTSLASSIPFNAVPALREKVPRISRQGSLTDDISLTIHIIADQDSLSFASKNKWQTTMSSGTLALSKDLTSAFIHWTSQKNYTGSLNYKGRGIELSDLKVFNGKLYTVDDKTGIVYRVTEDELIPFSILSFNNYPSAPFKGEWLTVRNNVLYCGSHGRETTTSIGEYIDDNPMQIKKISSKGGVESEDWTTKYLQLRRNITIQFPGYIIHESAQWSDIHQKWFFLPRSISKLAYNSETANDIGANILLSTADCFCNVSLVQIGELTAPGTSTLGFSAFQFVPGTDDRVIAALKTHEHRVGGALHLESYIMVFTIDGRIILPETKLDGNFKYEGLEFFDFGHEDTKEKPVDSDPHHI